RLASAEEVADRPDPGALFGAIPALTGWREGQAPGEYVLDVPDPATAAPEVARAVIRAGGSLLRLAEAVPSLEQAYLDVVEGRA
ncbi:MAG TPA: hypothetical protein VNN79_21925, partial [Actinomycetota bacterium]|nr:hypothetical protein [Actinomycetota bacterium]